MSACPGALPKACVALGRWPLALLLLLATQWACNAANEQPGAGVQSASVASSATAGGNDGPSSGEGAGGGGGGGGGGGPRALQNVLAALRLHPAAAMLEQSRGSGWPAAVAGGHLFVSLKPHLDRLVGDHDGWLGTPMQQEDGFAWVVVTAESGSRYKFSDGSNYEADPWSRAYAFDDFGLMSQLPGVGGHLERHFDVGDRSIAGRTIRVWVPEGAATHVLYAHDGQNLFDPESLWGGWGLGTHVPASMMVVAVDNGPKRMDEYTHVPDDLGSGQLGGHADPYLGYLVSTVRELVGTHYGEPLKRGILGSSLGGLVSLYAAYRYPDLFAFAASMSGTLGWGSIGLKAGMQNETIIEKYRNQAPVKTVLYIDSGGSGVCMDTDNDGILDDGPSGSDNYCVSKQLVDELAMNGKILGQSLFYWHEPGAPHNEQAWGARVALPLDLFSTL